MVYRNNLVAAIKVNGRILRENKETVAVPFGAEYSVLVKNLSTVRALVRISVDGTDATENTWLIVPANDSIELERFIRNSNFERGNRFKFIERTGKIEEHRGIGADDGLVRIEYKFEQPVPTYFPPYVYTWSVPDHHHNLVNPQFTNTSGGQFLGGVVTKSCAAPPSSPLRSRSLHNVQTNFVASSLGEECCFNSLDADVAEAGITVPGSESQQKFAVGAWFPTESTTHAITLKLTGAVGDRRVKQAVTVERKPKCVTCGKVNRATSRCCDQCGTALELF